MRNLLLISLFSMTIPLSSGAIISQESIRPPAMAGQFYPANPEILREEIERFLSNVHNPKSVPQKIIGMIVPHAGYNYSAQTAAYAYHLIQDKPFDVIVIIGPYHNAQFPGVSIWTHGAWQTPLGNMEIDEKRAQDIQKESSDFSYSPKIHASEHSLEVQIPFLQIVAPKSKIIPILISDLKYAAPIAQALQKHLEGVSALIIASTDLSHYHTDPVAREIDQRTQNIFQTLSPEAFKEAYEKGEVELCGAAAVLTLLEFSRLQPQTELLNLHYANSSESTSDKTNVVGYNASVMTESGKMQDPQSQIIKVARQ